MDSAHLWVALALAGALAVMLDAGRRAGAAVPVLGALLLGPLGLPMHLASRARPDGPSARVLRVAGLAAPGVVAGDLLARALDLPLGFGIFAVLALAAASLWRLGQWFGSPATPSDAAVLAAMVAGLLALLAFLAPRSLAAWELGAAAHWALLSAGMAAGAVVALAGLASAAARPRKALGREAAFGIAALALAAGFLVASLAGTLRVADHTVRANCDGGMDGMDGMEGMAGMGGDETAGTGGSGMDGMEGMGGMGGMGGMEGMGGMGGMDGMGGMGGMAEMPAPIDCPDESAMGGMDMGGMDMRPTERDGAFVASPNARGGIPMEGTLGPDGVRTYELRTGLLRWNILPDVTVDAYAYNDQLPGPLLLLNANESVVIRVTNGLPENTTVHLHGLQIPNDMDGVPYIGQDPILPGGTFEHRFRVPDTPGTFFYHTHFEPDRQQALGLSGPLIIRGGAGDAGGANDPAAVDVPVMINEWVVRDGRTYPAMDQPGMQPNFFTLNGKSWPETETIRVKVGDLVRLRVVGAGQFIHPMHLHGQPFTIVATDGSPVPEASRLVKDTVLVGPGERYDLEFRARAPGTWLFHCHINDHLTNNGATVEGEGGLSMRIVVEP